MAIETELKLRLQPKAMARLKRHPLFKSHQIAAPTTRRLHNIYFDTPDLLLNRHEMALRLRRVGGRWLQTLKGGGQVRAGLHQRNEWEVPVAKAELDFAALDAEIWAACLPVEQRAKLRPLFVTDFYRTTRRVSWQGAVIEVAMDSGYVRAEAGSCPICEVELELKSGDPRQLFELALAILDIVPFGLESVSKAELGFRLRAGHVAQPVKAEPVALGEDLAEGLQTQLWSCLQHLQRNVSGGSALSEHHAEYLHQTRVALRRLRVLLRLVEQLQADETLAALRIEVAEVCVLLGELREWDVFIQGLMRMSLPSDEDFKCLLAQIMTRRDACYARLQNSVHSRALQRLMLHFSLWMMGAYWQQAIATPPCKFASRHLQKLQRRWLSMNEALDERDAVRLHALRIVVKKLRYSTEFFASLYKATAVRRYHAALCDVQEQLGLSHDVTVACRLLDELAENRQLLPQNSLIAQLRSQFLAQRAASSDGLASAMARLNETAAFW